EAEFGQPAFQIVPRFQADLPCGTLRLGLIATQQDVPPHLPDSQPGGDLGEAHSTTTALFESVPISGTVISTVSPGRSAASSVTIMPVPVRRTEAAGTGLHRSRYSSSVSNFRCRRAVDVLPEKSISPKRSIVQVISRW